MSEIMIKSDKDIIANIVLKGDISQLNPNEKVKYYNMFCESLGLNPVTKPFQIISFQGKESLYATKDATEQLRKINKVSIVGLQKEFKDMLYIVTAKALDKDNRTDVSTGVVNIALLKGEQLANAIMKAETKAKRRVTLSICGLGILDESELDGMPIHQVKDISPKPEYNEFDQKWAQLETIMIKIIDKITPSEKKEYDLKVIAKQSGQIKTIKAIDNIIEYFTKKYPDEINKKEELFSIDDSSNSKIEPDLKLDIKEIK
jgi:hypothetical protein